MARRVPRWLPPLVLAILAAIPYLDSLKAPLLWDDQSSISTNPCIVHFWPLPFWAPPDSVVAGRPVVCLTLAMNYAISGLHPWSYHLVNLLIHGCCALLLYALIRRTLQLPRWEEKWRSGAGGYAMVVALLWAVHPIQTDAVTYITQRTECLASLFLLATLYCSLRASDGVHPRTWQVGAIVACGLGLGCKEWMAMAPILVILYEFIFLPPLARKNRRLLHLGLPLTWLLLPLFLSHVNMSNKSGFGPGRISSWDYLKTQAGVICHYLRLVFWPHPLCLDYFDWPIATRLGPVLLPGLFLLVLLGVTTCCIFRSSWLGFAGAWFFLILAPTSSVLPIMTEVAAERRMYLPSAAVIAVVAAALWRAGSGMPRWIWGTAVALLACVLSIATAARNWDYRSDLAIWTDTVTKRPNDARAHLHVAFALFHLHDVKGAIAELQTTLRLEPRYTDARVLLRELQPPK